MKKVVFVIYDETENENSSSKVNVEIRRGLPDAEAYALLETVMQRMLPKEKTPAISL